MLPTLKDLQGAAIDSILECTKNDAPEPPTYEEVLKDSAVILTPGCRRLGLPVTSFGALDTPPVPESLTDQLRGRTYELGLTVAWKDEPHIVVFISARWPGPFTDIDLFLARQESYEIALGRVIPTDADILMLSITSAVNLR